MVAGFMSLVSPMVSWPSPLHHRVMSPKSYVKFRSSRFDTRIGLKEPHRSVLKRRRTEQRHYEIRAHGSRIVRHATRAEP